MRKYWGILFTLALLGACQEEKVVVNHDALKISPVEDPIVTRFGFNFEEFNVHLDTIKYGDSFGELMLKNQVEYPKIATISEKIRDTFDVRKIRLSKQY